MGNIYRVQCSPSRQKWQETLQEGRMYDCRGNFCLYWKEPHKTGDEKIYEEYKMEATVQCKRRLDKCDVYTTKETLGYKERKSYVSAARGAAKEKKNRERLKKKQTYRQTIGAPNKEEWSAHEKKEQRKWRKRHL